MSTPDKPDPARGWQFVERLMADGNADGNAGGNNMEPDESDEEVERQMREQGVTVSRVPSADELLAKAAARSGAGVVADKKGSTPIRRVDPKARWAAALLLAAAFCGVVVFAVTRKNENEIPPVAGLPFAERLRIEGLEACQAGRWTECEERLDAARAVDPKSDKDPRVVAARRAMMLAIPRSDAGKMR